VLAASLLAMGDVLVVFSGAGGGGKEDDAEQERGEFYDESGDAAEG
jgi:hypothetical protein